MIIAVAGIKRSGSTVQFNLIRIALEHAGYKVNVCGHDYHPREVSGREADLVKRHPFSRDIAEAAGHIFLTDRPDQDILSSLSRFNQSPADPDRLPRMRAEMELWRNHTDFFHCFEYKDWLRDPIRWTDGIISALGLDDVYAPFVLEEFRRIRPPKHGQDPVTLMFHNHITG